MNAPLPTWPTPPTPTFYAPPPRALDATRDERDADDAPRLVRSQNDDADAVAAPSPATSAGPRAEDAAPTIALHARAKRSQRRARSMPKRAKTWALARLRPKALKRPRALAAAALAKRRDKGAELAHAVISAVGVMVANVARDWRGRGAMGKIGIVFSLARSGAKAAGAALANACVKCWAPKAHGMITAAVVALASKNARSGGVVEAVVRRLELGGVVGAYASRAAAAAPRVARDALKSWAQWQGVRLFLRVFAPRQARKIDYSMRVTPVLASYMMAKKRIARIDDVEKRDAAWERQHQWGAARMRDVIEDFGGFYRKVGQIAGTAKQMMPAPYIECFSKTMDNNPPVSFRKVRGTLENSLGGPLGLHFAELSRKPVATASIAQVHFGRLLDGREVAVKVQATDSAMMIGDIYNMLSTTKAMRWLGLNEGLDFPTIFRAYLDVIDDEFDFTIEARKTEEFAKLLDEAGLSDRIVVPTVITATRRVLIMRRVRGMKLLTLFNRARSNNKIPRCPSPVAKCHAIGGRGWRGVFHTMFEAWGVMMLHHGHFHSDPHPGNFMVSNDGKLVLLDWGQTKRVSDVERMHMCRLTLYMANEDHYSVAYEIRKHGSVRLEKPTTEALSALAYAYFDTRPSALAEMNVMDFKNSPFVRNKIVQNTQEGFFAIRSVFLLRGMLSTCGLEMSMVEAWESIARRALIENGHVPPSRLRLKAQKVLNRSVVGLQRRLNVGSGAKLNTLDAYMSTREPTSDAPGRWPSSSSFW